MKEFDRYAAVVFWGVDVHKLRTALPRLHVATGVSRLRRWGRAGWRAAFRGGWGGVFGWVGWGLVNTL